MSDPITVDSRHNDWGVLHRILADDAEHRVLKLRLRDVPPSAGKREIKSALERAGRIFAEGAILWGNHTVLPHDEWLDLDSSAAEEITYSDLLDEARGEKRVTLRLPIGLHAQLVKTAKGQSFNQFVIDRLSDSIGYAEESIEPAIPRLARQMNIPETEVREKMARASKERANFKGRGDERAERMRGHFAQIASLPPDQIKGQLTAMYSRPEFVEAIKRVHQPDFVQTMSPEQLAELAESQGLTPEELTERFARLTSATADWNLDDAIQKMASASPSDTKDIVLYLREVFTNRADALASREESD